MTRKRKWTTGKAIKDKEGKVLMEVEDIKNRWFEYVGELFHEETEEMRPEVRIEDSRPIMTDEIEWALRKMKRGKAAGKTQCESNMNHVDKESQRTRLSLWDLVV